MRPSLKNTDAGNDTKTGPLNEESPDDSEDSLVSVDIILPEDCFYIIPKLFALRNCPLQVSNDHFPLFVLAILAISFSDVLSSAMVIPICINVSLLVFKYTYLVDQ